MKKILILCICMITMFACEDRYPVDEKANQVVVAMYKALNKVETLYIKEEASINIKDENNVYNVALSLDSDRSVDFKDRKMLATSKVNQVVLGFNKNQNIQVYGIGDEYDSMYFMRVDDGEFAPIKQAMNIEIESIMGVLFDLEQPTYEANAKRDGNTVDRVKAVLSNAKLEELFDAMGGQQVMNGVNFNNLHLFVPVTIDIDKNTHLPISFDIDLKAAFAPYEGRLNQKGIRINEMYDRITFIEYDQPIENIVPSELTNYKVDDGGIYYEQAMNEQVGWEDFTFTIDNQTYQLPISYHDFSSKSGYTFDESDSGMRLQPSEIVEYITLYNKDYEEVRVYLQNPTDQIIPYEEAMVIGMYTYDNDANVKLFNDLKIGSKTNEVYPNYTKAYIQDGVKYQFYYNISDTQYLWIELGEFDEVVSILLYKEKE